MSSTRILIKIVPVKYSGPKPKEKSQTHLTDTRCQSGPKKNNQALLSHKFKRLRTGPSIQEESTRARNKSLPGNKPNNKSEPRKNPSRSHTPKETKSIQGQERAGKEAGKRNSNKERQLMKLPEQSRNIVKLGGVIVPRDRLGERSSQGGTRSQEVRNRKSNKKPPGSSPKP
ncbi:hypothetical protein C922_05559 [Plasmodium inui San Antonio 1]|uniref:Uncharacterized protein n=1 Tax=Plasmodium inui San Antonio 1 TaxID=1237626 RepID=W6ZT37_9APIC|nr:hypothetical protein C922_05559 [Plasmodium inui San Antonio 1]EUD64062.1 hypothetical protein C922_05559 [Plasmodium inui San Antonio 1]